MWAEWRGAKARGHACSAWAAPVRVRSTRRRPSSAAASLLQMRFSLPVRHQKTRGFNWHYMHTRTCLWCAVVMAITSSRPMRFRHVPRRYQAAVSSGCEHVTLSNACAASSMRSISNSTRPRLYCSRKSLGSIASALSNSCQHTV